MTKNTIKVFGSRQLSDGFVERRIFKNLHQCECWIGFMPGIAQGLSFTRGSDVCYKYAYNKGKRRSFNHIHTAQDYSDWFCWYENCRRKALDND